MKGCNKTNEKEILFMGRVYPIERSKGKMINKNNN